MTAKFKPPAWFIRPAVTADIPVLVTFRLAMFEGMGQLAEEMKTPLTF
jgi:hypothetical protein